MANNRDNHRIKGKIIIKACLKNTSPLLIGKGAGDSADHEVMQLPDGRPYIPASSLAGSVKQFMQSHGLGEFNNHLWGKTGREEKNPLQSHVRFDDLVPDNFDLTFISRRDGVKINHTTGIAEEGKKYDYNLIEPRLVFPFQAEITIRQNMKLDEVMAFVANLKAVMHHSAFRLGAFTNTGFGKFTCTDFHAYHFDFPANSTQWFEFIKSGELNFPEMEVVESPQIVQAGSFSIEAVFRLKTSLIIGSYGIKGDEPDKSQLKSKDGHVLPGKSIRGAIRHRAVKILNTLGEEKAEDRIKCLFGHVDEKKNEQKKGRLRIEEFLFQDDEVEPMVQNRIRIDRFTGGVIDGALFNSEPIWTKGQEAIKLTFTILKEAQPEERKLLMLLLKDLWMEDLAIGGEKNVGRGILIGLKASIYKEGDLIVKFQRNGDGPGLTFTKGDAATINELFQPENSTI